MTIQIKLMDPAKYKELLDEDGDTVPLYYVNALHFLPPLPITDKEARRRADSDEDDEFGVFGTQDEYHYLPCVLLNVQEAAYHKELDGSTVYILPSDISQIEYEMLSTIHPEKNAWAYRIETKFWNAYNQDREDSDDPMDEAFWFFKPLNIPDYDLGKKETH